MNVFRSIKVFICATVFITAGLLTGSGVRAFDSFEKSVAGAKEMTWAQTGGVVGTRPTGQVHGAITREALSGLGFKNEVVESIIEGNWHADWDEASFSITEFDVVPNDKYKPEHHFDRNQNENSSDSFTRGAKYLKEQRAIAISGLKGADGKTLKDAAQAMGRALHAMQDFFSHSNVIDLSPAEWDKVIAALNNATAPPATLKITGYDRKKGGDIAGDTFGHDAFCKDNPAKNAEAKSKMAANSKDFNKNLTKFDRAKQAAVKYSKEWLTGIKNEVSANAWPK